MEPTIVKLLSSSLNSLELLFFSSVSSSHPLYQQENPLATAVGVGGGLFIAIMTFGKETGGHFNPAVTTGYFFFLVRERCRYLKNYFILIFAQFLGGLFAGLLLYICSESEPILAPAEGNIIGSILDEIIFTFIFLLVIFCVKSRYTAHTKDGVLGALTVSMTLSFTVIYGGEISGECYNPAVGFALNIWAALANSNAKYLKYLYLYILAPLAGGIISGAVVKFYLNKRILNIFIEEMENDKQSGEICIIKNVDESQISHDDGINTATPFKKI